MRDRQTPFLAHHFFVVSARTPQGPNVYSGLNPSHRRSSPRRAPAPALKAARLSAVGAFVRSQPAHTPNMQKSPTQLASEDLALSHFFIFFLQHPRPGRPLDQTNPQSRGRAGGRASRGAG